ncbi:hypothetical protein I3F58_11315 [Streptomyces sp. MUM 203J]|uniref:lipoprotein n=1 Tax=Streptomyces sp. MUM 203J TaxID=2791990 RepID=UPI001F03F559|nr:lipoprotein [Streptomyces sp. MUM 203J]MCH0540148.1 hypothetical protein [Streptomyces sp. MUM 203J]
MRQGTVRGYGAGTSAVAASLLLAGCGAGAPEAAGGPEASGGPRTTAGASPGGKAAKAAEPEGTRIGAAGSACELPVTFEVAEDWKPKKVEEPGETDSEEIKELFEALAVRGGLRTSCEIDAKPAGFIGLIRVYTDDRADGTPREVLESYMKDSGTTESVEYRDVKAGGLAAAEVSYGTAGELLDEPKPSRALAVVTPGGSVVLHVGGLDREEHEGMLPAFELAKRTLEKAP